MLKDTYKKYLDGINLTLDEVEEFLYSRRFNYIQAAIDQMEYYKEIDKFLPRLTELVGCSDDIISSDCLVLVNKIDRKEALKISLQNIAYTKPFLQSESLIIIGATNDISYLPIVKKEEERTVMSLWREVCFLRCYWELSKDKVYIEEIVDILKRTKSHHTLCNAINALSFIRESAPNTHILDEAVANIRNKMDLTGGVTSTIDDYFAHAQS
jgi:CBS domain-containing protein